LKNTKNTEKGTTEYKIDFFLGINKKLTRKTQENLKKKTLYMALKQKYLALALAHKNHLAVLGVKLPKFENSKGGCKLGYALTILFANFGEFMHIDAIKKKVEEAGLTLTGTDPLQVRHLSTQKGWWIVKEGKYKHKLVSVTECLPGFIAEKRASKLNDENWAKMKKEYGYSCVNCGSKEGGMLRWDQTKTTVLQQGHMDPRKDITYDNCIPQCQFCNQQYKSKAVFNKRGFVIDFCKSGF